MYSYLANLTWLTSGTYTAPLWGGIAAIGGTFLSVLAVLFWIWMLADAVNRKLSAISKLLWLIFIFCTGLGALVYFLVYTPKLNRKSIWFKVAIGFAILACLPVTISIAMLLIHA